MNGTLMHLYKELKKDRNSDAQIYETIIEYKHQHPESKDDVQSLYLDIKAWCYAYIVSRQEQDFGYDVYERRRILEKIRGPLLSARQKLLLAKYVKNILSRYNDSGDWMDDYTVPYRLEVLRKENFIKYFILLASYSKWRCVQSILLFYLIELIILLPAPFSWMEMFSLETVEYSNIYFLNHAANVLALKVDWIEGPKLLCTNWLGVVAGGLWMLLYVVIIVNLLFNNIFSNISDKDEY